MQRKLRLVIAYDGTDFHGWQRQSGASAAAADASAGEACSSDAPGGASDAPVAIRTAQGELETVARRVLGEPVNLVGASRTDAGVHARGQVAHVLYRGPIPAANVTRAVNHRLPPDVTIVHCRDVPLTFHATQHAQLKLYRYSIYNHPAPPSDARTGRYAWHVLFPLDLARVRAAATALVGTHDFAAFASQGSPRETTVRTVSQIGVRRVGRLVLIDVRGTGFLYNQVRNMVGTLYEVGRGHWAPERVAAILASGDRAQAGPTAPPHGLCLEWIRYPALPDVGAAEQPEDDACSSPDA
jgi:tRNA pseudouridine38-40 synthase